MQPEPLGMSTGRSQVSTLRPPNRLSCADWVQRCLAHTCAMQQKITLNLCDECMARLKADEKTANTHNTGSSRARRDQLLEHLRQVLQQHLVAAGTERERTLAAKAGALRCAERQNDRVVQLSRRGSRLAGPPSP